MKIAVTGASGFIGRHVLNRLATLNGVELVAVYRDSTSAAVAQGLASTAIFDIAKPSRDAFDALGRPDILIHAAWGGLPNYRSLHHFAEELPQQYAFLSTLVRAGLRSLLVTGTCYEYGLINGELTEATPGRPVNPYGYAKAALCTQLQFLRTEIPFELTWARLFYVYGSGQSNSSLIPQLAAAIGRGDLKFPMSGGEQLRDYLPVEVASDFLVRLALSGRGAGIVNICSGRPVSIRALVERWLELRGVHIQLELGRYPYVDYEPMAFWGSTEKLRSLLGSDFPSRLS